MIMRAALELFHNRNHPGVVAVCQGALTDDPGNMHLRLLLARALLALRRDAEAQHELSLCLEHSPRCPEAYRLLGELALRRDELKSAEIFARESLRLDPGNDTSRELLENRALPSSTDRGGGKTPGGHRRGRSSLSLSPSPSLSHAPIPLVPPGPPRAGTNRRRYFFRRRRARPGAARTPFRRVSGPDRRAQRPTAARRPRLPPLQRRPTGCRRRRPGLHLPAQGRMGGPRLPRQPAPLGASGASTGLPSYSVACPVSAPRCSPPRLRP